MYFKGVESFILYSSIGISLPTIELFNKKFILEVKLFERLENKTL